MPTPASGWAKSRSIAGTSDGTSRALQPTRRKLAYPRATTPPRPRSATSGTASRSRRNRSVRVDREAGLQGIPPCLERDRPPRVRVGAIAVPRGTAAGPVGRARQHDLARSRQERRGNRNEPVASNRVLVGLRVDILVQVPHEPLAAIVAREATDQEGGGHADVPGGRGKRGARDVALREAGARLPGGETHRVGRAEGDQRPDPPGRAQGPSLERDRRGEQPAHDAAGAVPD